MRINAKLIRTVERAAHKGEIFCTDEEAARLGIPDKAVLADLIRHLYHVKRSIKLSTNPRKPGEMAGYSYRY